MTCDIDSSNENEAWCGERRAQVAAHLKSERLKHRELADWPAWHVAPIVSIWAVENQSATREIACWVICGDVPTDTISAQSTMTPRAAVRAFATKWHDAASQMAKANPAKIQTSGKLERAHELALFLEVRARQLTDWANDDSMWDVDDL